MGETLPMILAGLALAALGLALAALAHGLHARGQTRRYKAMASPRRGKP